ncbi:unnamed protein product, partial [Owenia fusiformis]
ALINGVKSQIIESREQKKMKIAAVKKQREDHMRIMNPKLPPIMDGVAATPGPALTRTGTSHSLQRANTLSSIGTPSRSMSPRKSAGTVRQSAGLSRKSAGTMRNSTVGMGFRQQTLPPDGHQNRAKQNIRLLRSKLKIKTPGSRLSQLVQKIRASEFSARGSEKIEFEDSASAIRSKSRLSPMLIREISSLSLKVPLMDVLPQVESTSLAPIDQ